MLEKQDGGIQLNSLRKAIGVPSRHADIPLVPPSLREVATVRLTEGVLNKSFVVTLIFHALKPCRLSFCHFTKGRKEIQGVP